jgi:hypothetical protein
MKETDKYLFKLNHETVSSNIPSVLTCAFCGSKSTMSQTHAESKDIGVGNKMHREFIGFRFCPNRKCMSIHLVIYSELESSVKLQYPLSKIDFDKEGIPENVLNALEQAVDCHAQGSYIASAIMIRKTMEEVCHHFEAKGGNLEKRIEALGEKVILPKPLLDGMHSLRYLGNDAAHVECRTYNDVGEQEVQTGIRFVKEILKSLFQYNELLKELNSLKAEIEPEKP